MIVTDHGWSKGMTYSILEHADLRRRHMSGINHQPGRSMRMTIWLIRLLVYLPFGLLGSRPIAALGLAGAYVASVGMYDEPFGAFLSIGAGVAFTYAICRSLARTLHPGEMPERVRRERAPRRLRIPSVRIVAPVQSAPSLSTVTRRLSPALQATLGPAPPAPKPAPVVTPAAQPATT